MGDLLGWLGGMLGRVWRRVRVGVTIGITDMLRGVLGVVVRRRGVHGVGRIGRRVMGGMMVVPGVDMGGRVTVHVAMRYVVAGDKV